MKKAAAISLIALLFFNWYGYQLLMDYLQYRSDSRLEVKLDNNQYDPSQLVEVRIPINLPYQTDWDHFERFNGEIEFNGVHYKYVKRKVENGELVLLCIPNKGKQVIENARDEFFKLVNDLQQEQGGKKTGAGAIAVKNITKDYRQEKNNWTIAALLMPGVDYPAAQRQFLSPGFTVTPDQPPEASWCC